METCSERCTGCSVRAVSRSEGHCGGIGQDAAESELGVEDRELGWMLWTYFFEKLKKFS